MNWYKNLRVKSKLLISFIIIIVFVVALAVLAYMTVNDLDKDYTYLLEYPEKRLQYLSDLDSNLIDIRRTTSTLSLFAENNESINNYWAQFEEAYEKAQDNIDKYIESNNNDEVRNSAELQKNNEIIQGLRKQIENYEEIANRAKAVALETHNPSAASAVFLSGVSIITEIQETSGQLVNSAKEYMDMKSAENTQSKDATVLLFVIIAIVIVILSIVIALLVSAMISKPLLKVSGMMDQVGNSGSLVFSEETKRDLEKEAMGKDEIAQTIASSVKTIQHFEKISQILQQVADGDLTAELTLLSENDTMGLSLRKMIDNLNVMFGEIHICSTQVATASKQIADGAQSLAQGSTEQASAVEQLSVSINEVAYKTGQNAGIAREASELSSTIMGNAEKGAEQMEQMMQAVQEINEASNQIKKVIKVIDDIAFQTNILALNAAVEAARAGQHGKGFAVVAEEVRNLAAKSANAAKETGSLIENSVEKANFGLNIAHETSASLKDIVEGINRSADIVLQIAQSSDEQAGAITQINTGIDQVAQVVQQNSATAQESAAASEEMSSQTDMLEQMILRFKLKDSHKGLAPSPVHKQLPMSGRNSYSLYDDEDGGFGKY